MSFTHADGHFIYTAYSPGIRTSRMNGGVPTNHRHIKEVKMSKNTIPSLPIEAMNRGLDWMILVGKRPGYPFDKVTKRSGDTPDKFYYDVNLPGNNFTALSIAIPGGIDVLSNVTDEQISDGCATLRPVLVRFSNCMVKIYAVKTVNDSVEQKMSATADGVELVKSNK